MIGTLDCNSTKPYLYIIIVHMFNDNAKPGEKACISATPDEVIKCYQYKCDSNNQDCSWVLTSTQEPVLIASQSMLIRSGGLNVDIILPLLSISIFALSFFQQIFK